MTLLGNPKERRSRLSSSRFFTRPNVPFSGGIETDRLRLRRLHERDAPTIAGYLSKEEVALQSVAPTLPYTIDDALEWIRASEKHWNWGAEYILGIERRDDGQFIGALSMQIIPGWFSRRGVLGYWLGMPHWGQGLGAEAVEAFLLFCQAHVKLRSISARVFDDNAASRRVLEKNGFEKIRSKRIRLSGGRGRKKIITYRLRIR